MAGLARILGVLFHRCGQLLHAGCRLFQRSGLLLGARREIVIAGSDFAGTAIDGIGPVAHITDGTHQLSLHMAQTLCQLPHLIRAIHLNRFHQIAACNMTNAVNQAIHWRYQRGFNTEPDGEDDRQYDDHHAHQNPHRLAVGGIVIADGDIMEPIVLFHVSHILLLETVLISLSRLIKELVDFACT